MVQIYKDLINRGLVENSSDENGVIEELNKDMISFYCGFDPTAPSLQIGNLLAIITMRRLQLAGHRPICLMGGATGMIGDPSGRSSERVLLTEETILENINGQKKQLESLLDFNCGENSAILVNNYDWFKKFNILDYMRDIGKRFRLSDMLAKESVKSRLESESGISLTEFMYQTLQAYDFNYLHEKYNVTIQLGGSDQWGNITAGTDLTRKMSSTSVFGLVTPLITDSSGKKFGKSEGVAIMLDPNQTSPYSMYQFLLNSTDDMVDRYLKFLTFLSLEDIGKLEISTKEVPHERQAQKKLAKEVTMLVHGEDGLASAIKATKIFFGEIIENLTDKDLKAIFKDVPSITLKREDLIKGITIIDLLSSTPLFKSKGEARRALTQKGVYLNNIPLASIDMIVNESNLASETSIVIRKGKKNYSIIQFS